MEDFIVPERGEKKGKKKKKKDKKKTNKKGKGKGGKVVMEEEVRASESWSEMIAKTIPPAHN